MSAKKLGFGLMRLPSLDPNDPSKIDMEQTKKNGGYVPPAWVYLL